MSTLIVVPARGGSKGVPGKNLRLVGGRTLVARAVEAASEFVRSRPDFPALIVVDTDSEEIANEGRRAGATVPFLRPPELARDETPTLDSVLHLTSRVQREIGPVETILLLQPTSPLRTAQDIAGCWSAYDPASAPSVVSVTRCDHPPQLTLRLGAGGSLDWMFGPPGPSYRRQDLAPGYRPNGAVYIDSVEFLLRERSFLVAGRTLGVEMPADRSVDIDSESDLRIAEAMLA